MLRHFSGIPSEIRQPSLTDNVLSIHLSGPKRIRRWQNGRSEVWDVERNSVTTIPSMVGNRWVTEGPIDFAHLTLGLPTLSRIAQEEFDRDPHGLTLVDRVGQTHPLLSELFLGLLRDSVQGGSQLLYRESLLTALVMVLLRDCANVERPLPDPMQQPAARGGLAGWQKRRVLEYMDENLARDIGTAELVALVGLSRAQFFRAFRQSTGQSPQRYLMGLRMEHAKHLLGTQGASVAQAASSVGFDCPRRFADAFRREVGVAARLYRCAVSARR
jgi:AraC family transcriptional regulator